jgi:outer membrane protein TolC
VFGLELSNLPVTRPLLDSHPMAGVQMKLSQRLPGPGEPAARAALADGRVRLSERSIDEAANALRGEVRRGYWQLALIRQLRGLTEAHIDQVDGLVQAVRARYEVGAVAPHDLLQLELRRDRLAQQVLDLDQQEAELLALLNGALARDPGTPIGTPERTPVVGLPGTAQSRREALEDNPKLALLDHQAGVGRLEAERARIERAPSPSVWLGYRVRVAQDNGDPGTNFVSAGLSVPLPAASSRRWKAEELAAGQRTRAAEQAGEATRVRLTASLAAVESRYDRAVARAHAWRDQLVPAADATLRSTLSAYRVDRAGFSDLIRAEIELLDLQRELRRSEAEAAVARVGVETLLGAQP